MSRVVLIVPGWQNSGPGHWQSLWEAKVKGALRVEMPNWEFPRRPEWVEALDDAVARAWRETETEPVLVGHSLGCTTIVHWAKGARWPVRSALLVAPADVDREDCPEPLRNFRPCPRRALPFPSILVASRDDPYAAPEASAALATAWGSQLVMLDRAGHINQAAGFGEWPRGEALLRDLM
ncbi:MAG: alpha/beta fold hydrolase [Holophagaceae bacterium]